MLRNKAPEPRTFKEFPEQKLCPVCNTNDEGTCVLVVIDGTTEDHIAEAECVHLGCAIATNINRYAGRKILYRIIEEVKKDGNPATRVGG